MEAATPNCIIIIFSPRCSIYYSLDAFWSCSSSQWDPTRDRCQDSRVSLHQVDNREKTPNAVVSLRGAVQVYSVQRRRRAKELIGIFRIVGEIMS